jgi:hypothetical protein
LIATLVLGIGTLMAVPVALKLYRVSKALLDLSDKRRASDQAALDDSLKDVEPAALQQSLSRLKKHDDAFGDVLTQWRTRLEVRQGAWNKVNALLFIGGFFLAVASDLIPLAVDQCLVAVPSQSTAPNPQ